MKNIKSKTIILTTIGFISYAVSVMACYVLNHDEQCKDAIAPVCTNSCIGTIYTPKKDTAVDAAEDGCGMSAKSTKTVEISLAFLQMTKIKFSNGDCLGCGDPSFLTPSIPIGENCTMDTLDGDRCGNCD
jgi:ferredoxin-like protein FixX